MDNGQFRRKAWRIGLMIEGLRSRLLLFVLLSLILAAAAFPQQNNSNLILVDEFGAINCEDLLARLDNLAVAVQNAPDSKGYIVIHPSVDFVYSFAFRLAIISQFRFRDFDLDRFEVITAEPRGEFLAQLWLGTDKLKPDVKKYKPSNSVPLRMIPMLALSDEVYLTESYEEYFPFNELCILDSLNLQQVSHLLDFNRNLSLKILIFGESRKNARRLKKLIAKELSEVGISASDYVLETRIFLPSKKTEEDIESNRRFRVNFWLVNRTQIRTPK